MSDKKIKGYVLKNPEKVERALEGTLTDKGTYVGGVRNSDGTYDDAALLAEYDRLGGYIETKEGDKVVTGSFYDFKNRKPHKEPQVKTVFFVNGEFVEVPADKPVPGIVKAAKILKEETKKASAKKAVKKA